MELFLLAMLSCVPKTPPEAAPHPAAQAGPAQEDNSGRIGMRFKALPEGLLVEEVQDGMGAQDAGLVPGDLVIAVGDLAAAGTPAGEVRSAIIGPPGSSVRMTVRAPLTAVERQVEVERRAPPTSSPRRSTQRTPTPPAIRSFNAALRRGTAEDAEAAARDLLTADLGGQSLGEAVRGGLRLGARENPDGAQAAMQVLDEPGASDWLYQRARGEALALMDKPSAASRALQRAHSLRPADHASLDGVSSDFGGDPQARRLMIESAWKAEQRGIAIGQARALFRTGYHSDELLHLLGMAPMNDHTPWKAALPPLPDFSVQLLDGTPWALSEQEGDVVVLAFWATWCGPCRKEMPELDALWETRREDGVSFLAISTDAPQDRDKVAPKANELGIRFPVAHQPELGADFNVTGIPAIRVINRSGALHYAARGYSESSVAQLDAQIEEALAQQDGETILGPAWSQHAGSALQHFIPLPGASDIWSNGQRTIVGVDGGVPIVFDGPLQTRPETDIDVEDAGTAGRVAWLDALGGPVAAAPRERVVRAWGANGALQWMQTTEAPVVDLATSQGHAWVATRAKVHAFLPDGSLAESHDLALVDLAPGTDGVWGVGDGRRWWLAPGQPPEDRGPAPDGHRIDEAGGVSTAVAAELIVGRFGPDGALRPVAVKPDHTIIAAGDDGRPAFTWKLSQPAHITAGDLDGDGQDELLVSIARQGVAVVQLTLP